MLYSYLVYRLSTYCFILALLVNTSFIPLQAQTSNPIDRTNEKIIFLSGPTLLDPHKLNIMNTDGSSRAVLLPSITTYPRTSPQLPVVSPSGDLIIKNSETNNVDVLDLKGNRLKSLRAPNFPATPLSWSNDGKQILFSIWNGNQESTEIYKLDYASDRFTQLTNDNAKNFFASWSPSGDRIAYMSDYQLWLMDADGSNKQKLIEQEARKLAWSPDGKMIAFESSLSGDIREFDIWVVNVDGTNLRNLTRTVGLVEFDPVWSPDSTHVAYESSLMNGDGQIYITNLQSGEQHQLTESGNNIVVAWTKSDENEILNANLSGYISDQSGHTLAFVKDGNIWLIQEDGSGLTKLTSLPREKDRYIPYTWSPTGREIAYILDGDVRIINIATWHQRQITTDARAEAVDWHNSRIAVIREIDSPITVGKDVKISYVELGKDAEELVDVSPDLVVGPPVPLSSDIQLRWSPDGQWIAMSYSGLAGGIASVYGSIFINDIGLNLAWRHQTSQLLYFKQISETASNYFGVWLIDPATQNRTQISTAIGDYFPPYINYSSDDQYVVVSSAPYLKVTKRDSAEQIFLIEERALNPTWSPQGDALVYLKWNQGASLLPVSGSILIVNSDGTNQHEIVSDSAINPTWQPIPNNLTQDKPICQPANCSPSMIVFSSDSEGFPKADVNGCIVHIFADTDELSGGVKTVSLFGPLREMPYIGQLLDESSILKGEKWAVEVVKAVEGKQTYLDVAWIIFKDIVIDKLTTDKANEIFKKLPILRDNIPASYQEALKSWVIKPILAEIATWIEKHASQLLEHYKESLSWEYAHLPHCIDSDTSSSVNEPACFPDYIAFAQEYPGVFNYLTRAKLLDCNNSQSDQQSIKSFPTEIRLDESEASYISSVTFSPDGKLIAITASNGVILYDLGSGERIRDIPAEKFVNSVTFIPNGRMMATATALCDIQIWNTADHTLIQTLVDEENSIIEGTEAPGSDVVFSPDGATLVSTCHSDLTFWHVEDWKPIKLEQAHYGWISKPAFSPDSTLLLTGSTDGTFKLWDVSSGSILYTGAESSVPMVGHVGFSPDGTIFAASLLPDGILLKEVTSKETYTFLPSNGTSDPLFAFAPDNKLLAIANYGEATIKLISWHESIEHNVLNIDNPISGLAFHPKRNLLAVVMRDNPVVQLWDLEKILAPASSSSENVTPTVAIESSITMSNSSETRVIVLVENLNVRNGDGTDFGSLAQVASGTVLEVIGQNTDGSWLQVCCVSSQEGWVINNPEYIQIDGDSSIQVAEPKVVLPVATPTSPNQACQSPVGSDFITLYQRAGNIAGCPLGNVFTSKMAYQLFQNGVMFWLPGQHSDAGGTIYVLYNSGRWESYQDGWVAGMPISGGYATPSGLVEPIQGFGLIWRTQLGGPNAEIGWAVGRENGTDYGQIQEFSSGSRIFYFPKQSPVIVLSNETWIR